MPSREKIAAIFARDPSCRPGFWTGNPVAETTTRYLTELGLSEREDYRGETNRPAGRASIAARKPTSLQVVVSPSNP